jgi:hypothetical protein
LHYIIDRVVSEYRRIDVFPLTQRIIDLYPGILTSGTKSILLEAHSAYVRSGSVNGELPQELKSVIRLLLEKGVDPREEFQKFLL